MAPKKRARGDDGAAAVSPPTIIDVGEEDNRFSHETVGCMCSVIDKSKSSLIKPAFLCVKTVTKPSSAYLAVAISYADLPNEASLLSNDLSRVPDPAGKSTADLFVEEPKSVLFTGRGSTQDILYDKLIQFDEPVLLKRIVVSGLNLGVTKATLSVAPSHFRPGTGECHETAEKSDAFFYSGGAGSPQPIEPIVTFEPAGFVGTRFRLYERMLSDKGVANSTRLNWMAAYRSGVKIEYERYTPGVGSAGLHSLGADLAALLDNEDLCDVTFVCSEDSGEVRAVKAVLAARCAYFRTLLFGAHREARQERVNIECSAPALRIVLGFLLTGTGNTALPLQPPEVLVDAHKLADAYLLPALQALCLHALHANLAVDNCQATLLVAHRRGLPDAKNVCLGFMVNNHDETFKDNRLDEIIGANEPGLLREMFAAASEFMAEGENPSLGDHTEHTHF